jgi:hypothetical protein
MRAILLLASLLAACAGPAALVGRPAGELTGALGSQIGEYADPDGSRILAFSYGYYSGVTYLARVDPAGIVRDVRQVLVEENFQRIVPGMTREEVLRLIGPPLETMDFARQRELSWEYRFTDAWGYRAFFYVNFDPRGIVVGKFTRRLENERFPFR